MGIPTKTKIICTIGPSTATEEMVLRLLDAGMNVARLNFSHGSYEQHAATISLLKSAREKRDVPLAIMLDTKGPEIRVGTFPSEQISLEKGDRVQLVKETGSQTRIPINPPEVLSELEEGMTVLFDDGYIASHVREVSKDGVFVEMLNSGVLKNNKGINVPGATFSMPAVTEKDRADILFGIEQDVDLIAASFVCSSDHILQIKEILKEKSAFAIKVIAKIESSLGVENFDSIVHMADGIMVARGDLGVELPIEQIPSLQKSFVTKTLSLGKPAIIATQMLESMIQNPRPTRAEVSDVANAIYDGASTLMLSGETAVGAYPIEALTVMKKTIAESEADYNYREFFMANSRDDFFDIASSVAAASVKISYGSKARAIVACTTSGTTVRSIARFKPQIPILTITPSAKTYHQLSMNWGVIPILFEGVAHLEEAVDAATCFGMQNKILMYGDLIIITAGTPFGVSGSTNMMIVENIGEVLVRARESEGQRVTGQVAVFIKTSEEEYNHLKGKIAMTSSCDASYLPVLRHAKALILQNHPDDECSEMHAIKIGQELSIPVVVRADGAMSQLKEGQTITLDPERGLIFDGIVSSEEEMTDKVCYKHFNRLGQGLYERDKPQQ